jgi:hypothetical protein
MKPTLLDTETGERRESCSDFDDYWWAEGNGACDCNRRLLFGLSEDPSRENTCEGCHRFLIVTADKSAYSLRELNEGYPEELLRQHGLI